MGWVHGFAVYGKRTSSTTGRNLHFISDDYNKVHLARPLEKGERTGNYRADCIWMWSQDGIFKQRNECYLKLRNEPDSAENPLKTSLDYLVL